jgi:hypothetical protein
VRFIDFSLKARSRDGNRLYYLWSPFLLSIYKSSFWLSPQLIEIEVVSLRSSKLKIGTYDERFVSSHTRTANDGKNREINVSMHFLIAETSQTMDLTPIWFEKERQYTFSLNAPPPFEQVLTCNISVDLYRSHVNIYRIDSRTDIRQRDTKADAAQGGAELITEEANDGEITVGMPIIAPVL